MQVLIESVSLLAAFISGVRAYRFMNVFLKRIFFQLIVWIGLYLAAWAITLYQKYSEIELDNSSWFNIIIVAETSLLMYAACAYYKQRAHRQAILLLSGLFILVFFIQLTLQGFYKFSNYAGVMEGIIVVMVYTPMLYFESGHEDFSWKSSQVLWLVCGLLLYFTGIIPYLSLLNYLTREDLHSSQVLFGQIIDVLANIRYFCLAIAFWLVRRNALR